MTPEELARLKTIEFYLVLDSELGSPHDSGSGKEGPIFGPFDHLDYDLTTNIIHARNLTEEGPEWVDIPIKSTTYNSWIEYNGERYNHIKCFEKSCINLERVIPFDQSKISTHPHIRV